MGDYNFHNSNSELGQTKILGNLPEEIKKQEALKASSSHTPNHSTTQHLGDAKEFLNCVQSENMDDDGDYMSDDDIELLKQKNRRFIKIVVAIAAMIGLVLCIIGFKIMTNFLDKGMETPVEAAPVLSEESDMLVLAITDKEEFLIYDLTSKQNYTVKTSIDTTIIDRNGNEGQLRDILPGDILRMRVITSNQMAIEMRYPSDAWIKEGITGCQINTMEKTISLDGEGISGAGVFAYTDDTLFLYKENQLRPSDITTVDTLTIQGVGDTVWSVRATSYHGYITVSNMDSITNGQISIDGKDAIALKDVIRLPIEEGVHELYINGDNIEPRTETVFVIADEEKVINLSAAQSKTGVLIVKVNVPDYQLYINGAEANTDVPVVLPQGTGYSVSVYKHGYKPWSMSVDVLEPSVTVEAVLTSEVVGSGLLTIHTTPSGASVTMDGTYLGLSPITKETALGEHEVRLQLNGYEPYQGTISTKNATEMVTIPLKSLPDEVQSRRPNNDETEQQSNSASEFPAPTPQSE